VWETQISVLILCERDDRHRCATIERMIPGERFEVSVDGAVLAGERWSDGEPPIVLCHAGVADRRSWRTLAPLLTDLGGVVALDRRGFGETPPAGEPFSHAADLVAALAALDAGPAWLVGSSMGGGVALDAALEAPERVAGLVLFAAAVSGQPDADDALDPDTEPIDAALGATEDPDEINRLEAWLWLDGPTVPEGRVQGPERELVEAMNAIVIAHERDEVSDGASGVDAWSRLGELQVPVTVAWGALDVPQIIVECAMAAAQIPGAQTVVIEDAAHLPYLERPAEAAAVVRAALSRA